MEGHLTVEQDAGVRFSVWGPFSKLIQHSGFVQPVGRWFLTPETLVQIQEPDPKLNNYSGMV